MNLLASKETLADAIALILRAEGRWSNDEKDLGGKHKWGVSEKYYPQVNDPDFDLVDAIDIYRKFIADSKILELAVAASRDFAYLHFSFSFNVGPQRAIQALQSFLFSLSGSDLKLDGLYGPRTDSLLKEISGDTPPEQLVGWYQGFLSGWYTSHGFSTSQRYFIKGWINRVTSVFADTVANREEDRVKVLEWLSKAEAERISGDSLYEEIKGG
jgi:lysozyme family protein